MEPSPVGIDGNLAIDARATVATCASAALPGHLWVSLGLLFANELSGSGRGREEGHDGLDSEGGHHHGRDSSSWQ
jgi:hypothetical protein